ncbi:MAG: hypothetical protein ACYC3W_06045 [Candidatus Nanopelagicales bacterium]
MSMRSGRLLKAALVVMTALSLVAPPAMAQAHDRKPSVTPSDSPSATSKGSSSGRKSPDQELHAAVEAWKAASRLYRNASAARAAAIVTINETFTAAVRKAKSLYTAARAASATPAAKSAAASHLADAVAAATSVRQAAIDALPPLPTPPGSKPTLKSLAAAKAEPRPFVG